MTHGTTKGPEPGEKTGAWRLSGSSSLYLQEAAGQRVEWYPWGAEAFKEAKRTRRMILLDIGAVWCHWCHVMDQGTYSDPEVVRIINEFFVPVKVDRDENPEVDRRYQRDIGILTGSGGWPLTAFLTPEGDTVLGGTYFPPRDQGRHPGMVRVLREVSRMWREEPGSLKENVGIIREAASRIESVAHKDHALALPDSAGAIALSLGQAFDSANGGFGTAPKFPHPIAISLLLTQAWRTGDPDFAEQAKLTLHKMAEGGMYDQLGEGFHRYSVDAGWHLPHFEKMTLDNAHLLRAYVDGAAYFGGSEFRATIEGVLAYCEAVLRPPDCLGYAASVDADNSPGDDGSYYTWTRDQLRSILSSEEFKVVQWRYGIGADGSMPMDPDHNVLYQLLPPGEIAANLKKDVGEVEGLLGTARKKMLEAREKRPKPLVDTAVYSSLNGHLIGAIARAGRHTGSEEAIRHARDVADALIKVGFDKERGMVHRAGPGPISGWGLLEDQAAFALGLLELAEASGDGKYLEVASQLLEITFREYLVPETGLLRDLAPRLYEAVEGAPIGSRPSYPLEDSPHLSANAAVVLALFRLGDLHEDPTSIEKGQKLVEAMMSRVHGAGLFAAGTALASLELNTPPVRIVVEGKGAAAERLYRAAVETFHPRKTVFRGAPKPPFSLPGEAAAAASSGSNDVRALLCQGTSCQPPIQEADALRTAITALAPKR